MKKKYSKEFINCLKIVNKMWMKGFLEQFKFYCKIQEIQKIIEKQNRKFYGKGEIVEISKKVVIPEILKQMGNT